MDENNLKNLRAKIQKCVCPYCGWHKTNFAYPRGDSRWFAGILSCQKCHNEFHQEEMVVVTYILEKGGQSE